MAAGFACPREWKARLTSREYEEVKALSRSEPVGPDRNDLGRVKAAVGVMTTMAKLGDYDPNNLFPIPQPERDTTDDEQFVNAELLGSAIDRQWQPNQLEP